MIQKTIERRLFDKKRSRQSFFGILLKSHMTIAAIGIGALLIAIITISLQARSAQLLSARAIPVSQASASVLRGIQHSLASMRGWVSLSDEYFIGDWQKVWEENIDPAVQELRQLGSSMHLPGFEKRMAELSLLLTELHESQWWIFEIAQTPGNEPAKLLHQFEIDPVILTLDRIIHSLLDAEKGTLTAALHDSDRNTLHDTALFYYVVRAQMQKIIFRGEIDLEKTYLYNLHMLKSSVAKLSQVLIGNKRLDDLMLHLQQELGVLEKVSVEAIAIRKSNTWNVSRHLMETETVPLAKRVVKVVDTMVSDTNRLMTRQAETTARIGTFASIGLSILLIVLLIVSVIFSRNRAAVLSKPVFTLAKAARQLAAGELSRDIAVNSNDELGDLTRSFNFMRKELKDNQERMLRQEKLAAIGKLSGSVAHDIRNPLGAISNSIYFLGLISTKETNTQITEHISLMQQEINRANGIITDLLDFSRDKEPDFSSGNANDFLQQIVEKFDFSPQIKVNLELDQDLPTILFDDSQLQRVISNLLTNASQAMVDGGQLGIHSDHNKDSIMITVSDSGDGIEEESLETIFEPLFTTRATGVGLGLSIVKDLVARHHGNIEVKSVKGQGSTFTICLPREQRPVKKS